MAPQFPIIRILGGLFFVLAGVVYYLGITLTASIALVFIGGGAAVLLLAVLGHRAHGGDLAVFVIGLLVLSAFLTPGIGAPSPGSERVTHTVTKAGLSAHQIDLLASADTGSINIFYSDKPDLGYQVNFTRSPLPFGLWPGFNPATSLTNETRGASFFLNATARSYDLSVAIGTGYVLNITATTGTGSVNVRSLAGETLGSVSLESGTGSVNGNLTSLKVGAIRFQAGTGSVNLNSNHLAPNGARVPVTLSAGTGSVNLKMKLTSGTAVSLTASAGFGSVSHNLQGFVVNQQSSAGSKLEASAGDINTAAASFVVHLTTGTGSVSANSQFLG